MARPSTEIIEKYNIIEQFQRYSSHLLSHLIWLFGLFDSLLTFILTVKWPQLSIFTCCAARHQCVNTGVAVIMCVSWWLVVVYCVDRPILWHGPVAALRYGLKTVINLQRPGEHASCGNPLEQESGFTYRPETFMEAGGESLYSPSPTHPVDSLTTELINIGRYVWYVHYLIKGAAPHIYISKSLVVASVTSALWQLHYNN